jgi:hypothetical protein
MEIMMIKKTYHIITRPDTALLGAACHGFEQEKLL